jgi:hypothetical protein
MQCPHGPQNAQKTILVVDDDEDVLSWSPAATTCSPPAASKKPFSNREITKAKYICFFRPPNAGTDRH